MSISIEPTATAEPAAIAPQGHARAIRPFIWSVRREIWENASVYIAPVAAAILTLAAFAFVVGKARLDVPGMDLSRLEMSDTPTLMLMAVSGFILLGTTSVVGLFYALGALQHERRERSILFWKSLPVSDAVTVLAKAAVPIVVLPCISIAVMVVTHVLLLAGGAVFLAAHGVDATLALGQPGLVRVEVLLIYLTFALALWHAPVYGWALLVSGWARNVSLLWAVLPPAGLAIFQMLAFGDDSVGRIMRHRLFQGPVAAFRMSRPEIEGLRGFNMAEPHTDMPLPHIDPMGFLASPGLWLGLAFAGACLAAAVWLRRYRDPV